MNAPVFLMHPGKQVNQGCNREITPKKTLFGNNFVNETENVMAVIMKQANEYPSFSIASR